MVHTVTTIALAVLIAAAGLCVVRLVRGTSVADRIVALDALLLVSVSGVAVLAIRFDTTIFLPTLVVASLIAFIGTITVARFIDERAGR
jgi:multicomponent Na+:H+ antiporter subunit F